MSTCPAWSKLSARRTFSDPGTRADTPEPGESLSCRRLAGRLLSGWLALFLPAASTALVTETGDFIREAERLRDLAFPRDSALYVAPTPRQQDDFGALSRSLFAGDLAAAEAQAPALGYELVHFVDSTTGRSFYGLREPLVGGASTLGWGSYFVHLSALEQVLVEVPHAVFDSRSWDLGAAVFRDANAAGFLMNGAHRDANGAGSADVAHLAESIFQEVHVAWSGAAGKPSAWQIHGFALTHHPSFPVDTDAVLSSGDGGVSAEILRADTALDGLGFLSHVFNTLPPADPLNTQVNGVVDGLTFSGLGATTNEQGILSRSLGAVFVHAEFERSVRLDATQRGLAAAAIVRAIRAPEPARWLQWSFALLGIALCARSPACPSPSSDLTDRLVCWTSSQAQRRVP